MSTTLQNIKLDELCNSIIDINKNIQSVAVINKFGRTVTKISKPSFTKQFPDYLNELFCMCCTLQVSMCKDFDENYGPVNYNVCERKSITIISFQLQNGILLVTTDKNAFTISIAKKIFEIIEALSWY